MKSNHDTKQKLIDVTRRMIDINGIASVNMRDLGKEMNLSRSAVYRHFKNKDDLLAAIVAENFEILINSMSKLIEEISDSRKLICAILYKYYDFGVCNREQYQLMFQKQWDKEQFSDLYILASKPFKMVEKRFEKIQKLECDMQKSPKELTAMVYAFIHGLVELNYSGHLEAEKGLDNPASLINSFVDMIFA
ncbi:MAG TPA: TetR/AcrR family transcriptional regulator [Firmicutes bacterium]|jgi:AcrR family transcriptional regulator|nr:TetR/AcrR family transcriptional regulator [Bacillota bacterium]